MNQTIDQYRRDLRGRRVALIGMGISNRAAVDFLLSCGAVLTARDKNPTPDKALISELSEKGIPFRFGEGYLDELCEEILFKSPGIRGDIPRLVAAKARGAMITSEMEVFCSLCPCRIFAVTGSDGKTTTTTVLYEMLKRAAKRIGNKVFVGGNIGTPLLPRIEEIGADDFVVLELSSFQLHTMCLSPSVAVITNISPNHLNWHTSMEEYIESKKNVFRGQTDACRLVLNAENEITCAMEHEATAPVTWFSSGKKPQGSACYLEGDTIFFADGETAIPVMARSDIRIMGMHNVENYMAAIAAAWGIVSPEEMRAVAMEFGGVRHRIEFVVQRDGVRYFNNSIGTSPARTIVALGAFSEPLIVIVGGYDKHIPVEPMLPPLAEKAKFVVGTGETGQSIVDNLVTFGYPVERTRYFAGFDDAVRFSMRIAQEGDTVLLSPAAASFDAFPNFEARGDRFCELVKENII